MRAHVIRAVFRRNFVSYFVSPVGYVFIFAFVLLAAVAAFLRDPFFGKNLANLDTLNEYFPYILILFVPAVTMGVWAEEKRQGTEELLLTLPAHDFEVVMGKYLAALGIYTVSLGFSLTLVAILVWLGRPDVGLLASTYLGYWLLGAAMLAVGMVGSALSSSQPVAFILGALFTAVFALLGHAGKMLPPEAEKVAVQFGVVSWFEELAGGMLTLRAVAYFLSLLVVMLHLNLVLLARRRWGAGPAPWLAGVRWLFLAAALAGANWMLGRGQTRIDATAEKLHSLAPETRDVIRQIQLDEPVYVHAYVTAEVPKDYVQTRATLLMLLKEYEALGEGRIVLSVKETEKHTPVAREAQEKFGIESQNIRPAEDSDAGPKDVYLGVAFVCGARESVVPFLFKGLSVEYELTRSLRVVSGQERRRVGVVSTDARFFGGIDFSGGGMRQAPEWEFVAELKKQYEVVQVQPGDPYPDSIDVLLVPMPSSLTQPQMTQLETFLKSDPPALVPDEECPKKDEGCRKKFEGFRKEGKRRVVPKGQEAGLCDACKVRAAKHGRDAWPVLVFEDPLPWCDPELAPWRPRKQPGGMMFGGGRAQEPKGDLKPVFDLLGMRCDTLNVVWSSYNPYPDLRWLPQEFLFVGKGGSVKALKVAKGMIVDAIESKTGSGTDPFHPQEPASSGLQSILLLYTGALKPLPGREGDFIPLLRSSRPSGTRAASMVRPGRDDGEETRGTPTHESYVLAARTKGRKTNAIAIADLDLIGNVFYNIRKEKWGNKEFDNIAFVLNCVDSLAGDEAFVNLRKRRARHRTLETIETEGLAYEETRLEEEQTAEETAKTRLKEARDRLDAKVKELEARTDIDEMAKIRMKEVLQETEQRRFDLAQTQIKDEKKMAIEQAMTRKNENVKGIQREIRIASVVLPPLPALVLGIVVLILRLVRERQTIPKERWVK